MSRKGVSPRQSAAERVFGFMSWFLEGARRRIMRDGSARAQSNRILREYLRHLGGDVINVSGWRDEDRADRHYKDYYGQVCSYSVTNIMGARGMPDDCDSSYQWHFLDLEAPVPSDMVAGYDVVFCHTVLEHIFDVASSFRALADLTRDIVVLVVPFVQRVHCSDSYSDYHRFSPYFLDRYFTQAGFTTLLCWFNQYPRSCIYVTFIAARHPELHPEFRNAPFQYDIPLGYARFGAAAARPASRRPTWS